MSKHFFINCRNRFNFYIVFWKGSENNLFSSKLISFWSVTDFVGIGYFKYAFDQKFLNSGLRENSGEKVGRLRVKFEHGSNFNVKFGGFSSCAEIFLVLRLEIIYPYCFIYPYIKLLIQQFKRISYFSLFIFKVLIENLVWIRDCGRDGVNIFMKQHKQNLCATAEFTIFESINFQA